MATYGISDKIEMYYGCSTGTGVLIYAYGHTSLQYGRRYGYRRSMYVSTATKNVIASILGSVCSPAYSFSCYHQLKTHSERRAQRRCPEGDIQSYYDSAVRHTFRVAYVRNRLAGMQNRYVVL